MDRVLDNWCYWRQKEGGTPEQYLSTLETKQGQPWREAVWYIALVVTLSTPRVVVSGRRPRIEGHTLNLANNVAPHDLFWNEVLGQHSDVSVVTTNYDILTERGLRLVPRPRLRLPGFNYGQVGEPLLGGKGPGVFHNPSPRTRGRVPVFKLHGSVSWAYGRFGLEKYHDCRPAIRGDAAIIAPVQEKHIPKAFDGVWSGAALALRNADVWIVIGYSFPAYDHAVNELLRVNHRSPTVAHVFNPDPSAAGRLAKIIGKRPVVSHGGLPEALTEMEAL